MELLCSIVIIMLLVSHGKSEKDVGESTRTAKARHLSRRNIAETFGAIKTIGKYLLNCKNGAADNRLDNPQNVSSGADVEDSPRPNDLSLAVFTISKNFFGRNITEKVVKPLVNLSHGKVSPDNRVCTTPDGSEGYCDDYKNCPQLDWDLFADSICFRNMFSTGVCCPKEPSEPKRDEPLDPKYLETQTTVNSSPNTKTLISTTQPSFENITSYIQAPIQQSKNSKISSECGQPEIPKFRIIGGVEALPGRWPWMAAIFIRGSYTCGGTLIGPRHILTAAHCTKNEIFISHKAKHFTVILGDVDLNRDDEPSSPEKYFVVDVRAHRKFGILNSENVMFNDIAILILDRPVKHNRYIMPLCLPLKSSKLDAFVGESSTIVGWGTMDDDGEASSVQRQVSFPVWSNEECKRIYRPYYFEENYICAGIRNGGKDACQGDSGGPLMLKKDGKWIQIGIVSFGNKCGEPLFPSVYTRVTGYLDWIEKNMI